MKQIEQLTSGELRRFHSRLARELNIRFVHSGPIAAVLRYFYDRYVARYMPTAIDAQAREELEKLNPMCVGNWVLLPWKPGTSQESQWMQILVAVHEAAHAVRVRNYPGNTAGWYREYFVNDDFRALEECSAQLAEGDVQFWLTGTFPKFRPEGYCLNHSARNLATRDYANTSQIARGVGRGNALNLASKEAIKILKGLGVGPI